MPDNNTLTSGEYLPKEIADKAALLIRMLSNPLQHQALLALQALLQMLANEGLTIHVIVDCVKQNSENKPVNAVEIQALYDAGYEQGYSAGVEHGRKTAVLAGAAPLGVFHAGYGVNGYTWKEIAEHCARNSHLFIGRELEFVESVADQVQWRSLSEPQTKWLRDLFMRRCGGKI